MQALLAELSALARRTPALGWAVPLMQNLPFEAEPAQPLPVRDRLADLKAPAQTRAVVAALKDAAADLRWQQTYMSADGFSQTWLDAYGWVNIVSPEGPFLSQSLRVAIGYWGAGQTYPAHAHAPQEDYVVLAGGALFEAEGRDPIAAQPGDGVSHAPWQPHAMTMTDQPLLAVAFWRGDQLTAPSRLDVMLESST